MTAGPPDVRSGVKEERLAVAIDALLDDLVGRGVEVGLQVAVIQNGRTLVDAARGVADPRRRWRRWRSPAWTTSWDSRSRGRSAIAPFVRTGAVDPARRSVWS